MKKISALLIVLMMLISISSLVLADEAGEDPEEDDDDQDIDNETQLETEIMNNTLGAEIRLLQLQKAIYKNLLKGEMAVNVLKGLEFNTTALEAILDEMNVLLEEVKVADTSSNESVQIFVELKIQAKNLTTQYRETIKELVDDVNLSGIREQIREMVNEQFQNLSKNIQNRIKQFNRNQLYRMYGIIGEANNSFVDDYLNGNVTLDQVRLHISKIINEMSKEKRFEIFSELKEDNIKNKIHSQAVIDEMQNNGNGKGKGKND
jgi:hypothetical protein